MADFPDLIFKLDLNDLPLIGGDFTWSNGRSWFRLDKFLVSSSWEVHFPNLCQVGFQDYVMINFHFFGLWGH